MTLIVDSFQCPKLRYVEEINMVCSKKRLFFVVALCIFSSQISYSAVSEKEQALVEELTGKKQLKNEKKQTKNVKSNQNKKLSQQHLMAGLEAFKNKDYQLALKHYNTVINKYRALKEVKSAYMAKAKLYSEMGLNDQAKLNITKAKAMNKIK